MGEDKLDKIIRLCSSLNEFHKLAVGFSVGCYSNPVPIYGVTIDKEFTPYSDLDTAIQSIEDLYNSQGRTHLKNELLQKIEDVQYELNKYQETLAKLEENHNAV